jgi:hypothetical protein
MIRPPTRLTGIPVPGLMVAACIGLGLIPWTGCGRRGPPMGSLTGTVVVEDTPLTRGFVMLSDPKSGIGVSVDIGPAGAFHLPAVRTGVYRVGFDDHVPSPEAMGKGARYEKLPIPDRYRYPSKSGLECEIKEGRNSVAFRIDRD